LLFSSRNAVWSFARVVEGLGPPVRDALGGPDVMVAAVGAGTAQAVTEAGLNVTLIPERFDGDALLEAFVAREGMGPSGRLDGVEVLFPRAEAARERLPEGLRERGAVVHLVATYRAHEDTEGLEALVRRVGEERLEAVTLTSGSAAHALGSKWGGRSWPPRVKVAVIGPVTARAAVDAGLPVDVVPERSSFVGLATALAEYMKRN
jgi:uroporphyrinogen III methyltransferase / synthase